MSKLVKQNRLSALSMFGEVSFDFHKSSCLVCYRREMSRLKKFAAPDYFGA